ncbi:hypothetical protein BBJ28_00012967, partial [Nothophytophthora sp. Chile5]
TLVNPWEFVESLPKDEPVVFIFGAMAHGHISKENCNYVRLDETISISEYPVRSPCRSLSPFYPLLRSLTYAYCCLLALNAQMSGAQAICRLLNGFERHWGIL